MNLYICTPRESHVFFLLKIIVKELKKHSKKMKKKKNRIKKLITQFQMLNRWVEEKNRREKHTSQNAKKQSN